MKRVLFLSLIFVVFILTANAQTKKLIQVPKNNIKMATNKMQVEIWSDVMCPFCYIGKRKFEAALAQFPHKDKIEIIWKSFELNPTLKTDTTKTIVQYLSETKGISIEQTKQMVAGAENMAKEVGLAYHLSNTKVANSFKAHRLSHFAKQKGKQDLLEEKLFKAYFTDTLNTDDDKVLMQIGKEVGFDEAELKALLESEQFAADVKQDELEAQQIGVRGVPFFALNRKYAISGAQDSQVMLGALEKAYAEWEKENPQLKMEIIEGKVCTPDGECK